MIWPFILLSYFSLFVFGLADNIRGPLFPEILKEFAVSDSVGSLMFALGSLSGLVASWAARHLLLRYDRRKVLQSAALVMAISLVGMSQAPAFWVFLFFSVGFGLSMGIVGLIPNVLVPLGSTPERKQRLLSGLHAFYGVASFLAPLVAASVGLLTGSWRWTFLVVSLAPLGLIGYSLHGSHAGLYKREPFSAEAHRAKRKKNLRPQIFLATMLSFTVAAEILVSSRLALYMRRVWDFDLEQSSLYVTYFFVGLLAGRFLFALVHFRASVRLQLTGSALLTAACFFAGIYLHPFFLVLTGFTVGPFYPLSISLISSEFPEDLDAAVSYMMATDSLMLVVMHLLVGKMSDVWGIESAMFTGPVFLFFSVVMINSYGRVFRRA